MLLEFGLPHRQVVPESQLKIYHISTFKQLQAHMISSEPPPMAITRTCRIPCSNTQQPEQSSAAYLTINPLDSAAATLEKVRIASENL